MDNLIHAKQARILSPPVNDNLRTEHTQFTVEEINRIVLNYFEKHSDYPPVLVEVVTGKGHTLNTILDSPQDKEGNLYHLLDSIRCEVNPDIVISIVCDKLDSLHRIL